MLMGAAPEGLVTQGTDRDWRVRTFGQPLSSARGSVASGAVIEPLCRRHEAS